MNLNPDQKIEISHDILAREVYARIGAEEKMRLKITQFLRERYDHYMEDEANGIKGEKLSKKDLNYIAPYLDRVKLTPGQQEFVRASRKAVRNRQITFWATLVLFVLALLAVAFVFYRLKVEADSAKVDAEENLVLAEKNLNYANFNLAKLYEEKAAIAWDKKEYAQSWLYTMRALDQDIGEERLLSVANGRLVLREHCPCPDMSADATWEMKGKPDQVVFPGAPEFGLIGILEKSATQTKAPSSRIFFADPVNEKSVQTGDYPVINSLAVTGGGEVIVSAHRDSTLRLWSGKTANQVSLQQSEDYSPGFEVLSIALGGGGRKLALGGIDGEVELREINQSKLAPSGTVFAGAPVSPVFAIAVSSQESYLAAGCKDGTLSVWDISDPGKTVLSAEYPAAIQDLSFSRDEALLAMVSEDSTLVVHSLADSLIFRHGREGLSRQDLSCVRFHPDPDRRVLATGSLNGEISLWVVTAADSLILGAYLKAFKEAVTAISFSADGKFLLGASQNGQVRKMPLVIGPFGQENEFDVVDFVRNPYSEDNQKKRRDLLQRAHAELPFSWDGERLELVLTDVYKLADVNLRYYGARRNFEAFQTTDHRFETIFGGPSNQWKMFTAEDAYAFKETRRDDQWIYLEGSNAGGNMAIRLRRQGGQAELRKNNQWTPYQDYTPWNQISTPGSFSYADRIATFSKVSINGEGPVIETNPGDEVEISLDWSIKVEKKEISCPTCITQLYHGIQDVYSACIVSTVISPNYFRGMTGTSTRKVKMPEKPGIYYLTGSGSWEYSCVERPQNHKNSQASAFGVIRVRSTEELDQGNR